MTFRPNQSPAYILPDQRSDYEESLIPARSQMITESVIDGIVTGSQQGIVKTQNDATIFAGVPTAEIAFYRWW